MVNMYEIKTRGSVSAAKKAGVSEAKKAAWCTSVLFTQTPISTFQPIVV